MDTNILKEIGFEEKEANIYLILLKIGVSPASSIAEELGYDRTTTYYALLKMVNKGYATYALKSDVKYFQPVAPEKILLKLKDREDAFSKLVPELKKLGKAGPLGFSMEVYKGKNGLNTIYRDIVNIGGELLSFGIDEEVFMEYDLVHFNRYVKEVDRGKLKERLLTYEGAKKFGSAKSKYRTIPKEFFSPTPVSVYGDKVAIVVWEPSLHIILVENKNLADSFRKHFELLWTIAKPIQKGLVS